MAAGFSRLGPLISALNGFSAGYQFYENRHLSSEIQQGKSEFLDCIINTAQLFTISSCAQKILMDYASRISRFYLRIPIKGMIQLTNIVVLTSIMPLLNSIKNGTYPVIYSFLLRIKTKSDEAELRDESQSEIYRLTMKGLSGLLRVFPQEFSPEIVRGVKYFIDHFGFFAVTGMVINTIGLMSLKENYYIGMLAAGMFCSQIFRMSFIPLKLRNYVQLYAPAVIDFQNLMSVSWVVKLQAAISLSNRFHYFRVKADNLVFHLVEVYLKKAISNFFSYALTKFANEKEINVNHLLSFYNLNKIRLFELNSNLKRRKDLSFEEIEAALLMNESDLIYNPAHFNASFDEVEAIKRSLEESNDLDQFQTAFDQIKWGDEKLFPLLKSKCKNDDRFIDHFKDIIIDLKIPLIAKDELVKRNFDQSVQELYRLDDERYVENVLIKWIDVQISKGGSDDTLSKAREKLRALRNGNGYQTMDEVTKNFFINDPRCITYLVERLSDFPGSSLNNPRWPFRVAFDDYLTKVEGKQGQSAQSFLLDWQHKQMQYFMKVLKGKKAFNGNSVDETEFFSNMRKIAGLLKTLNPIDLQDLLLNLSIEGGNYCGLALLDCSRERLNGLIMSNLLNFSKRVHQDVSEFERAIYKSFQNLREELVFKSVYSWMGKDEDGFNPTGSGKNRLGSAFQTTSDRHIFHFWKVAYSLGFSPLSKTEMDQLYFSQLLLFWVNRASPFPTEAHNLWIAEYKSKYFESLLNHEFNNQIIDYILDTIKQNEKLTDWQKDFLQQIIAADFDANEFKTQYPELTDEQRSSLNNFQENYSNNEFIKSLAPSTAFNDTYNKVTRSKPSLKLYVLLGVILGIFKCPEIKKA